QPWEPLELRFHHLHGIFREFHAGLIGRCDQFYDGTLALPRHRRSKPDHCLNRVEQGAIPVVFQDAPATLNGIVLTMVGRIVSQTYRQAGMVGKIHDAPHELGPSTMVLRAIIEVDDQGSNVGKPIVYYLPPPHETIDQTVTCYFGSDPIQKQFIQRRQGDTHWRHGRLWVKGVIDSNGRDTALATPRKRTDS